MLRSDSDVRSLTTRTAGTLDEGHPGRSAVARFRGWVDAAWDLLGDHGHALLAYRWNRCR